MVRAVLVSDKLRTLVLDYPTLSITPSTFYLYSPTVPYPPHHPLPVPNTRPLTTTPTRHASPSPLALGQETPALHPWPEDQLLQEEAQQGSERQRTHPRG